MMQPAVIQQAALRWWRHTLCIGHRATRGRTFHCSSPWGPRSLAPPPPHLHHVTAPQQALSVRRWALNATSYGTRADVDPEALPPLPEFCSGCGVRLQGSEPDRVGYFQVPKNWGMDKSSIIAGEAIESEDMLEETAGEAHVEMEDTRVNTGPGEEGWTTMEINDFDLAVEDWLDDYEKKKGKIGRRQEEESVDVSGWGGDEDDEDSSSPPLFCARCYSLTHYGKVKSTVAESQLPEFDIGKKVGQKIRLRHFRRSVVLVVVDISDFDGSLPRTALQALLPRDIETGGLRTPQDTDLVIAVNKVDLMPSEATHSRLENWARQRCKQGGVPRPRAVHLVSSTKGTGVPGLLKTLGSLVGRRGDVWVVGAQNSGKSSLINSLRIARKKAGGGGRVDPKKLLTIAALPGTTLGMVPVNGILPKGCQMFDTPGMPHPYQLTSILTAAEAKMLLAQRQLRPRTYRISAGTTVMLGAVARVDVKEIPGATIYLTVWASDELSTHMGQTETAGELYGKHAGSLLVPPSDPERVEALGRLEPHEVVVKGDSWTKSSADIAIAGLGWVAVGLVGKAEFRVWVPDGVAVTTRQAVLMDYAQTFCKPGFTAPKGSFTKERRTGPKTSGGRGSPSKKSNT